MRPVLEDGTQTTRHDAGDPYRRAGVDMDAAAALVRGLQSLTASTRQAGSNAALGGFGGVFDLAASGFKDPLLIAANDGVGTKLAVAIATERHESIGIDLVAMSVNDVVAQGGKPLLFLDYFATGRLDVAVAKRVVSGIAEGCKQAECVLIGGETAEMPGMYQDGDYDLAGFALGACERGDLLPRNNIQAGDVVFGLASSGFHANGFSLLRRLLDEKQIAYDAPFPPDTSKSIGEILLRPTRIYVASVLNAQPHIKALAQITGGGLLDNIPRALPKNLLARLDLSAWQLPPEMRWFQERGGWETAAMARTFNCGIGMAGIVAAEEKETLFASLRESGETVHEIGRVAESAEATPSVHLEGAWQ